MKSFQMIAACVMSAAAVLGGCASNAPQPYAGASGYPAMSSMNYGVIESITVTRAPAQTSGAGALIGGLVGGALGNQVGSGSGRTAATVAGAVGGALVGNNVESNRAAAGQELYQIALRLDNGDYRTIVQDSVADLRVGNRVRIVDGRVYRY